MAALNVARIRHAISFLQDNSARLLAPCIAATCINVQPVRHKNSKHWNPKFRKLRGLKIIKVEFPDFEQEKKFDKLTPDEMRAKLKEKGIAPPRPWMERPFYISCTGGVFEPYVPPEGDGKISVITMPGAKEKIRILEMKRRTMMAVRKIRSFDEDFEPHEFVDVAQEVYINAHNCLVDKDKTKLVEYVTERANPEMWDNILNKTIHWKFLQSLEPPRVVHVRTTDVISRDNIFAQITVRFHTQQVLAVYDRFGRLMHGSEMTAKDVLEYVVFERHLSNEYGQWRLHSKIIPDWMPPKEPVAKTYWKSEPLVVPDENKSSEDSSEKSSQVVVKEDERQPAIAAS